MSSLLASLASSGKALEAFERSLGVIQNNIDNASTPGYAKQQAVLSALPLDITGGLVGGVASRSLQSSRDEFADEGVRRQLELVGEFTAKSQSLGDIEGLFDVSGNSGVTAELNNLFQAFSGWSAAPNDQTARQSVIDRAASLAESIRDMSRSLQQSAGRTDSTIASDVGQINALARKIQQHNIERLRVPVSDPAADASLHSDLESLAQLVNITTLMQDDGTVTVLAGEGTPLVLGDQQYDLTSSTYLSATPAPANTGGPPTAHILDWQGKDVTAKLSGGQLGGLLDVRNRVLPSILGDGTQAGALNHFAKGLADSVNQLLQSGTVSAAPGAASGIALFAYDNSDPTRAAGSLTVNPAITASLLAPVDAGGTVNGNANALAALAGSTLASLGGLSLSSYFTGIAASIGRESQAAQTGLDAQQQAAAQARTLRDQISGVSLDEEAVRLIEFQRGYQAAARVLSVLSDLTDTTIRMIP